MTGVSGDGLVGESRALLVDGLVKAFDAVASGGLPLWLSFEGPSGWGKTRVIQELYSRLAVERQGDPPYWPPTMTSDDPDRKRINPAVQHRPGSRPDWAWWGIACAQRNGVAAVALAQDVAVLEAHAPYLELTWRERNPRGVIVGALRAAGAEGADFTIGTVGEAVLPGFELVKRLAQFTFGAVRDGRDRRALERDDAAVVADHDQTVRGVADTIVRLAAGGIPVILVVEDAHEADETLADLLHDLIAESAPILILSTAWPGHVDDNPRLVRAMRSYPERLVRVSATGGQPPWPFPAGAGLGPLPADALAAIARRALPPVDDATVERVVARYPNPLALELFGSLPAVHARARGGELSLTAEQLERFPPSLIGLYREVWDALPDPVRHALVLATLGIPEAISPGSGSTSWNRPALADVVRGLGMPSADDLARELADAPTAYHWARSVSETLRAFTEPEQLRIAAEAEFGYVDEDDKTAIYTELVRRAAAELPVDDAPATVESTHAAQVILALQREGFVTDAEPAVAAALHLLESLREQPREWAAREELLDRVTPLATAPVDILRLTELRAQLHRSRGRSAHALELVRDALPPAIDALGPDHPAVLRARTDLGTSLSGEGRWEEAIAEAEAVLSAQRRVLGEAHPETLRTRLGIAFDTEKLRGSAASLPLYRAVYNDSVTALGADDDRTIRAGVWGALARAEAGEPVTALAELERAQEVADRSADAAPDLVLRVSEARAVVLRLLGRNQDAAVIYDTLFGQAEAVLGSYDALMLWVAASYATLAADAGMTEVALEIRQKIIAARAATVGERHFHWFLAHLAYGSDLARVDLSAAREHAAQIAEQAAEALEPQAAEAMRARRRVIELDLQAGAVDDAGALRRLDALAAEIAAVVEAAASPAIAREAEAEGRAVQQVRVRLLAANDADEAVRLADELAQEEIAVARDVVGTLAAQARRADARALVGRPEQALALYLELLESVEGEAAEMAVTTAVRMDAANVAMQTGQADLALELGREAVNRMLRHGLLGSPEHLSALSEVATLATAAGAHDEARQACTFARENALARFGIHSPHTLAATAAAMEQLAGTDPDALVELADGTLAVLEESAESPPALGDAEQALRAVYAWAAFGYDGAGRTDDARRCAERAGIDLDAD